MKKNIYIKNLVVFLLILFIANCSGKKNYFSPAEKINAGFDIDDTLLFSSPNFDRAKEKFKFGSDEFWAEVNGNDEKYSIVKKSVLKIVEELLEKNYNVYAITARPEINDQPLKEYISKTFNIPLENVYFEPKTKIDRIKILNIKYFYGDADSDISDAIDAGAVGIRIQRSSKSSYKDPKTGFLVKYNPGKFKEKIIENSEE